MVTKNTIGFIGTGVMGKSMASHLMKAGYEVLVNNRTRSRADSLVENGAFWKNTPAEVAKDADIIITMVGYPKDVEAVYLGKDGILNNAKKGAYVIDMTTSEPSLAKKIYKIAKAKGVHSLDAPVSGGDVGAKNATLTIMVGGEQEAFNVMLPIFQVMGNNVILQGSAGAGQHTKMCNQIAIASNMIGVAEAMVYAKKSGLDPNKVLLSIGNGAAGSWSLNILGPRMIKGDFEPGFYVKHMVKDLNIAISEAEKIGFWTPGLKLSKSLYEMLIREKKENKGTQILFDLLDKS